MTPIEKIEMSIKECKSCVWIEKEGMIQDVTNDYDLDNSDGEWWRSCGALEFVVDSINKLW